MLKRAVATGIVAVTFLSSYGAFRGSAETNVQDFDQVERGRYLTIAGDCAACHTSPGSNQAFAGGRPIGTPFGDVLASNITPDLETGIGTWSDNDFVKALTRGIAPGGKHLYPAMPYTYYTKLTQDDAIAIRAYLRTVAPVHHPVKENQLAFPYNIRASLAGWNSLYFHEGQYQTHSDKTADWNRGAYLAEGLMHCGACHTPKNSLGGDKTSEYLKGYVIQGWFAPDIANSSYRGLGDWTPEDIVAYLKTGHNRFTAASGPMAEEIQLASSKMSDEDLKAVATYLKDQPPQNEQRPAALPSSEPAMKAGHNIFAAECSACHDRDGTGTPGLFPALKASSLVNSVDPTSLIHIVTTGSRSVGTLGAPTAPAMPAFGKSLTNKQIAAVVTYIRNSWGNAASIVTPQDVVDWRQHNNSSSR